MSTTPPPPSSLPWFGNASLYVGDLEESVTEGQLYHLFSGVATVVSVRVCRDHFSKVSLGYGYVNFKSAQDASKAMEILNFTSVNGKPIRIMLSHPDPRIWESERANVFIKNLDVSIDNKALHDMFAAFGVVLSCKVATDSNGQPKGYGFVQFEKEESAQNAIKTLNGTLTRDKQVYVCLFVRRQKRSQGNGSPKFTNVYVKHFCETTSDEDLEKVFGKYGLITSTVVMRDADGKSRGFGFVNFQNPDNAALAVEKLNGTVVDDRVWYVAKARRKAEREAVLGANLEQGGNGKLEKSESANLYLKNESVTDQSFKGQFSEYITSCKVVLDPQGQSRASGFVAFSTHGEANKVAHFAQLQTPIGMSYLPSIMPGYHLGGHWLALQQLYYGQRPLNFLPQFAYGFQQQQLPAIWPGAVPKYIVPYPPQKQLIQHDGYQGFRYLPNVQSGLDLSLVPQGLMSPIIATQLMCQYHNHHLTTRLLLHQTSYSEQIEFQSGNSSNQSAVDDSSSSKGVGSSRSKNPPCLRQIAEPFKDGEEGERVETVYKQGMVKTELCKNWEAMGTCTYGNRCQYAHGIQELRPVIRHPLYKTKICRMISCGRTCAYGPRCHYLHSLGSDGRKEEKMEESLNLEPGSDEEHEGEYHPEQLSSDAFDHQSSQVTQMPNTTTQVPSPVELPSPDVCEQDSNLNMPHQLFDRGRTQQCTINQQENIVSRVNRRTGTHTRLDVLRESSLSSHTLQQQPLVSAATAY